MVIVHSVVTSKPGLFGWQWTYWSSSDKIGVSGSEESLRRLPFFQNWAGLAVEESCTEAQSLSSREERKSRLHSDRDASVL